VSRGNKIVTHIYLRYVLQSCDLLTLCISSWYREVTLEPIESSEGGDAAFANESLLTVYGVVINRGEYLRAQSVHNILLC
jgi:hypothetical protein